MPQSHQPHAAMFRSPSSFRSLLHLSRRRVLLPTNPRLSSSPLPTRPRFLSSTSSPTPGGAGWATYDPLTDSLSASAARSSAPASASDSEAPAVSDAWGVYDPVSGRIVKQGSPPPSSSTTDEDEKEEEEAGELEDEEEAGVKEKGKKQASALGGNRQVRWSSVATARRPAAGKRSKEKSSYVCSNCGEGESQWWGICRHCSAVGTLVEFVAGSDGGGASAEGEGSQSHHIGRSWIPRKAKEMVPQSLQEVNKGVDQAEWRIPL